MESKGLFAPERLASITARVLITGIIFVTLLYFLAPGILRISITPSPGAAIIVLGGSPRSRAAMAASVYASTKPTLLLISGTGDCEKTKSFLVTNGVPETVMVLECESASTYENALFSRPYLLTNQNQRATIVTHWYHSRRALATFRKLIPEVQFSVQTTDQHLNEWGLPTPRGFSSAMREFLKVLYYYPKYRINSFADEEANKSSKRGEARLIERCGMSISS